MVFPKAVKKSGYIPSLIHGCTTWLLPLLVKKEASYYFSGSPTVVSRVVVPEMKERKVVLVFQSLNSKPDGFL